MNYVSTFRELLPYANIDDVQNELLITACKNNSLGIIKLILQDNKFDPSDRNNQALNFAKRTNNKKLYNLLITNEKVRELFELRHPNKRKYRT